VFGIALGYEDLNDHDELRHDPMMAILAGKLTARREDCAPVAGPGNPRARTTDLAYGQQTGMPEFFPACGLRVDLTGICSRTVK
jgi:hypothetical protein